MTTAPARTPTSRELVAARQAQTAAGQAATPAAPQVPAVPAQAQGRVVVPTTSESYRQRYLDDVAPSGIAGRLIKFTREGTYITTDDDQEVPAGSEFILLADDTLIGWIKFNGAGEAPDRQMGLLFDGFVMPERESLGDLDPKAWELGLDNQPADPWQHQQCLVLQDTRTAELYTFSTSSRTGRRAVGNLLRHYTRMQKTNPGELPVIRLGKGGFEHKDKRVGFVNTPVFVVCGRAPRDSAATPDTSIAAFINDELPENMR